MSNRCMVMENSRTMQVDTIHNIFDYPSNDYVKKLFKQVKKCINGNGYCKIISN
jgi:ABC-type proline/glycine betaine transport system ATPase subunit